MLILGLETNKLFTPKGTHIGTQNVAEVITFVTNLYLKNVKSKYFFNYGIFYK